MNLEDETTRKIVDTMVSYRHELDVLSKLDPEFDLCEAVLTFMELDREGIAWQEHA